jgi:hypothetical protein
MADAKLTPTQEKLERLRKRLKALTDVGLEGLDRKAKRKVEQIRKLRYLISQERAFRKSGHPEVNALFPDVAAKKGRRAGRARASPRSPRTG